MREPLKMLLNAIADKKNEDRLFDVISLFSLIIKNEITDEELQEMREYVKFI